MTQVKSAQPKSVQVALRAGKDARTLAQKRADLLAQVNAMALSDLQQVSARLKALHEELERKEGRRWTQLELAEATGIPYRTFQSWETGQVENRGGEGYKKIARFYSRKLGRRVTKEWIVFGEEGQERLRTAPNIPPMSNPSDEDRLKRVEEAVNRIEVTLRQNQTRLDQILDQMIRREAELIEEASGLVERDDIQEPGQERGPGDEAAR